MLTNNLFLNNSVGTSGGAIWIIAMSKDNSDTEIWPGTAYPCEKSTRISGAYDFVLMNNTFAGNSAAANGGAIRCNYTTETCGIFNSTFWENEAMYGNDIHYSGSDTLFVFYSNVDPDSVFGNWAGEGNIFEDPLFEGRGEYPYSLTWGSPCIDAGTPDTTGHNLPLGDIINHFRIWDGDEDGDTIVDMGAYVYDAIGVGLNPERITNYLLRIMNFPNPFSSSTTIEFELKQAQLVKIIIYNHLGQIVDKISLNGQKGINQTTWDAGSMPAGIYLCRVTSGNASATQKLVVVK